MVLANVPDLSLSSRAANRGVFKRGGFPIWTCPSFFVRNNRKGGTASLRSRTCVKRNVAFGARFKGLFLYFLYQNGKLIRIKTGLDTYLIRIQTRTPLWRYPPYDYSNLSFFVLFGTFPIFGGFSDLSGDLFWGFARLVLFLFLGLSAAPTRNSPERVRDTIWTFPEKSGKPPGLETPRFGNPPV